MPASKLPLQMAGRAQAAAGIVYPQEWTIGVVVNVVTGSALYSV